MQNNKVLVATHSDRRFLEARCSLNAFEKRFASRKQRQFAPFDNLPGVDTSIPFAGKLSLWRIMENSNCQPVFLGSYAPKFKVQSAAFRQDQLLVYGSDRLEVLDSDFNLVKTITDPWMAGGHTVYLDTSGDAWVTCAPSNSILRINVDAGTVVERLPMPVQYGRFYDLKPDDDVRSHYIPTDFQPTHVNCAFPANGKVFVTFFIPGAVGVFDETRQYRELVSGFRGCHGGKLTGDHSELYLTDSSSGIIWFFDPVEGRIRRRIQIDSIWLHDAEQVKDNIFAASLSDKNEIALIESDTGTVVHRIKCGSFGESVMFLNMQHVNDMWLKKLRPKPVVEALGDPSSALQLSSDLFPPFSTRHWWTQSTALVKCEKKDIVIFSPSPLKFDYLCGSNDILLRPGAYHFSGKVNCIQGGIGLGILDVKNDKWLETLVFDRFNASRNCQVSVAAETTIRLIVTACNYDTPEMVRGTIEKYSFKRIVDFVQQSA